MTTDLRAAEDAANPSKGDAVSELVVGWYLVDITLQTSYGPHKTTEARKWTGSTWASDDSGECVSDGYDGEYSNFRRLIPASPPSVQESEPAQKDIVVAGHKYSLRPRGTNVVIKARDEGLWLSEEGIWQTDYDAAIWFTEQAAAREFAEHVAKRERGGE